MAQLLFFLLYMVGVVLFRMFFNYLNATAQNTVRDRRDFQAAQAQLWVNVTAIFVVFFGVEHPLDPLGVLLILVGWSVGSWAMMIRFNGYPKIRIYRKLLQYGRTFLFKSVLPLILAILLTRLFFAGEPWLPYPLMGGLILIIIGLGYTILFAVIVPRLFDKKAYLRPFAPQPPIVEDPTVYVLKSRRLRLPINALYTGFFGRHSIWVSPALLATLSHDQIDGIIAHEIGHRRGRHLIVRLIVLVFTIAILLGCTALAFSSSLVHYLGFPDTFLYQFIIFLMLYQLAETLIESFFYRLSHHQEFAADRHAAHMGRGAALAQALFVIAHHQEEPLLHPLSRRWQFSHPNHHERLEALRREAHLEADYGFVFECYVKPARFRPSPVKASVLAPSKDENPS